MIQKTNIGNSFAIQINNPLEQEFALSGYPFHVHPHAKHEDSVHPVCLQLVALVHGSFICLSQSAEGRTCWTHGHNWHNSHWHRSLCPSVCACATFKNWKYVFPAELKFQLHLVSLSRCLVSASSSKAGRGFPKATAICLQTCEHSQDRTVFG